jgi:hypothetical protein
MKRLLAEFESVSHQTACPDSDGSLGGGGLAGKAAILNLAKKGIRVMCESLDSLAPALGSDLGLPWSNG